MGLRCLYFSIDVCGASVLLNTFILGFLSHPSSSRILSTISIFSSTFGSDASMTWMSRSDSIASSSVVRKDSKRSGGRSEINPIVSARRTGWCEFGMWISPSFVSSVAKSLFAA